jgi:hypothetical protein
VVATSSIRSSSSTTPGRRGASGAATVQQDGLAQRMRDLWGEAAEQVGLRVGEAEPAVNAVQAQVAPAVAAVDEGRAQLVAEPGRSHDVAVARAGHPRAAGGGVQRPHVPRGAHELGERVDVPAAELVVQEHRRHRDQRVLAVRAGEEQGLGVGGREERGVDRHGRAQDAEHLPLQRRGVQAAAADAQHRAFCARHVGHGVQCGREGAARKPHIAGMVRGRMRGRTFPA